MVDVLHSVVPSMYALVVYVPRQGIVVDRKGRGGVEGCIEKLGGGVGGGIDAVIPCIWNLVIRVPGVEPPVIDTTIPCFIQEAPFAVKVSLHPVMVAAVGRRIAIGADALVLVPVEDASQSSRNACVV